MAIPKVLIVGAGPAGLAAAYKLNGSADVKIIEQGKSIDSRSCPRKNGNGCVECKPCNITYGVGGAGCFSDGKLIFHTRTGNNLYEIVGDDKTRDLLKEVEKMFESYGVKINERDETQEHLMMTRAAQFGIEYVPARQTHVGSDKLPRIIQNIVNDLKAEVIVNEEVLDFNENTLRTKNKEYAFDYLLFATGRDGLLEKLVDPKKIHYEHNPVDIGVRVEVPASIMEEACSISWDFKARMMTPTYQDMMRTFCVCPYGFVAVENHDDFCLANGHSMKDKRSENTNFAFLSQWRPKEPIRSGNAYGRLIAEKTKAIWGGKPGVQRLGDLRRGQRSTWDRINRYSLPIPTLTDVTPGDIGSGLEYRFVLNVLEGLTILNNLIPGVANDSTLLYAPEIKFHGIRIKTDKYLESSVPNVYVAGDGAGVSRGIVGAASSGILAAEGILRRIKG